MVLFDLPESFGCRRDSARWQLIQPRRKPSSPVVLLSSGHNRIIVLGEILMLTQINLR